MNILIAGDFAPMNRVTKLLSEKRYESILEEVKPLTESVDFSIVNLESPIIYHRPTPIIKSGPNLFCTEDAVDALRWAGFDCVTLANNHFYDQGEQGVNDTLDSCSKFGMLHVGGGRTLQQAQQILYKEYHGQTIAIINACEEEFSIAAPHHGGANPLNEIDLYYTIIQARQQADYVVVILHGGVENYPYPTPRMVKSYRFLIDSGADAIINHHQHCYSGYEVYQGKPIFYGLGNFCFDNPNKPQSWHTGYMVEISLSHNNIQYTLHPYHQGTNDITGVQILKNGEASEMLNHINQINTHIGNHNLITADFEQYITSISNRRLRNLEPFYNPIIRKMQTKGLWPKMMKGRCLSDWYDRLNCATHREVLLPIIKNQLDS